MVAPVRVTPAMPPSKPPKPPPPPKPKRRRSTPPPEPGTSSEPAATSSARVALSRLRARLPSRWRLLLYTSAVLVGILGGLLVWLTSTPKRRRDQALVDPGAIEAAAADRLRAHVQALAGTIGPRVPGQGDGLGRAAAYITAQWRALGLEVAAHGYETPHGAVSNLEVVVPRGRTADRPALVVGAHYDTDPSAATPGADDNASGVALLIELGRALGEAELARPVRLVAFPCEEAPYFASAQMGSLQYVRRLQAAGIEVPRMLSLESLGFFTDARGSQRYPLPGLSALFPDRGNYVAVVGNLASRPFVTEVAGLLIAHSQLPVDSGSLPSWVPGVAWSDHRSFWRAGAQAVMLTDTAFNRNPHYHRPGDRPETLDYRAMAALAAALPRLVSELAR
jgi:hypothetical protein